MSVQIGICDDREEDIGILKEALYTYNPYFTIWDYTDGEALIEACRDDTIVFDILFLDIYMPGMDGIKTAHKIRTFNKETKIIFISSSNEHYPEAYDVFAFNYMIKPLNEAKLKHILDHALSSISIEGQQQISLSYKAKSYRVFCKDIQYIESRNKILYFHLVDKTIVQCYAKLGEILEQLPQETFIRCHQSFVVNIMHITVMENNYFRIDSAVISISKKHLKSAKDKYFAYLFAHLNRAF